MGEKERLSPRKVRQSPETSYSGVRELAAHPSYPCFPLSWPRRFQMPVLQGKKQEGAQSQALRGPGPNSDLASKTKNSWDGAWPEPRAGVRETAVHSSSA
jgi:hypothetical protein